MYEKITGKIAAVAPVVVEGNTHYYVALENSELLFDLDLSDDNLIGIIRYQPGDMIQMTYAPEESGLQVVSEISK